MLKHILSGIFLVIVALAVFADYEAQFRNGITAMDRRKWAEAATAMRRAIAENPTESSRKVFIYGTRYVEYTPHFYLGVALSKASDCAGATQALRASERQGVITRMAGYRELTQILARCAPSEPAEVRPEPVTPPVQKPPEPVKPVQTPPQPAPNTSTQPLPIPDTTKGPSSLPATTTSKPSNTASVSPTVAPIDPALIAARQRLSALVFDARKLADGPRPLARAAASRAALQRAITTASSAGNSNSVKSVQSAADTLTVAAADYRRLLSAPGEPDAQLADAVRAYIRGDYETTAALLERATFQTPKARGQAALFRAAARHAMYTLDGEKNTGLRTQAIADLREYRRLNKAQPDVRLFPPPFRRLYAETR